MSVRISGRGQGFCDDNTKDTKKRGRWESEIQILFRDMKNQKLFLHSNTSPGFDCQSCDVIKIHSKIKSICLQ